MPSLQLLETGFPLLQVQLSCYGDAIGGDLKALKSFLDNKLSGKYFKWFWHYNFCKCIHKQHLVLPVARMRNRQSMLLEYLQLCTIAMLEHLRFHPAGAISGLHLLPIYPSSGDGGFAPLTYQDVDPKFGTWDDVKKPWAQSMTCRWSAWSITFRLPPRSSKTTWQRVISQSSGTCSLIGTSSGEVGFCLSPSASALLQLCQAFRVF